MSYVAVKGGTDAIAASKDLYQQLINGTFPGIDKESGDHIFAIDRIMGEGALYTESLALKAIARTGCDLLEAAFYLRAHRSSCRRTGLAQKVSVDAIRPLRRISSAFKDVPGGQVLGPSSDYLIKLFGDHRSGKNSADENTTCQQAEIHGGNGLDNMPSALAELRAANKILMPEIIEEQPFDITRSSPLPPYPRSALMQVMARGETGSMLAFAYTSMRGYGDVHPTIGDLRIGMAAICFTHPFTGRKVIVGEIRVTAVETVGSFKKDPADGRLRLATGFGFCFGFNETKAIAMSILDLALTWPSFSIGGSGPATSPEMIMHHVDGIESMGFTNHFKMPHYVTFQADLHTFAAAGKNHE